MWLISTANPRGINTSIVLVSLLPSAVVCVPSSVGLCAHPSLPVLQWDRCDPSQPIEAGILVAAIAWGKGLWELGETLAFDCRTLTSHVTSLWNRAVCSSSFEHYPNAAAVGKCVLRRATAQDTEGHGKKILCNFAKDAVFKMLAMQLL